MTKRELIDYCLTYPGSYEDYPFDAEWAAIRHAGNKKTFAFVIQRGGRLCVNLKCEPLRAELLREAFPNVSPGYHMNKEHWNTVTLGGSLPAFELFDMIAHSYDLTRPKVKRKK